MTYPARTDAELAAGVIQVGETGCVVCCEQPVRAEIKLVWTSLALGVVLGLLVAALLSLWVRHD